MASARRQELEARVSAARRAVQRAERAWLIADQARKASKEKDLAAAKRALDDAQNAILDNHVAETGRD